MAGKVAFLAVVLSALLSFASAPARRASYSPSQYLKNYALSTCLADGFKSEEVVKDAAAAARGYLELGALPLEAYTQATKLGRTFLARDYKSVAGAKLTVMKCIDLFHSRELDDVARKYAPLK
jgi:hypothetical protein